MTEADLYKNLGLLALDLDLAVEREPDREKRIRLKGAHEALCRAFACLMIPGEARRYLGLSTSSPPRPPARSAR